MEITTLDSAIYKKVPEFMDLIPYLASFAHGVLDMDIPFDVTYLNISEYQCMCILAASFLCIIKPERDSGKHTIDISFQPLFTWDKADSHFAQQVGKIRSILNCFYVMQQSKYRFDKRVVFRHVSVKTAECDVFGAGGKIDEEKMQNHDGKMCPVIFTEKMVSIDTAKNAIQIDFANKYLGGGILSGGCVQEEIRFTVAPFCIIGHILCKIIAPNEAIAISGARIFSDSGSYKYGKGFTGPIPFTKTNTIWNTGDVPTLIAIDAVRYEKRSENTQYNETEKLKALLKAIVGFASHKGATEYPNTRVIATGNWGAGAFNGDKILKFLIQWVAASVTNCESIQYHLWDDTEIVPYARSIAGYRHGPLKDVYKLLMEYKKD
jgi:poly(ADP-ribose) glycohydrolase